MKSRHVRKKGLLQYFGDGLRMQPLSTEGTPIDEAKMRREKKSDDSNFTKERDSKEQNKAIGTKKSKSDNEESEAHEVDLEKMEKMPLKVKGKKDSVKKTKAKKDKGKSNTPESGKKKATISKTVGKDAVEEKEIDYKTCVVGFTVWVDKGKNTKGGFDKKFIKELTFMQTCID
jgi:hypothetical protein